MLFAYVLYDGCRRVLHAWSPDRVTGRVEEGTLRVGSEARINDRSARVDGIEASGQAVDEARAGDDVGLLFNSLDKSRVKRRNVITASG